MSDHVRNCTPLLGGCIKEHRKRPAASDFQDTLPVVSPGREADGLERVLLDGPESSPRAGRGSASARQLRRLMGRTFLIHLKNQIRQYMNEWPGVFVVEVQDRRKGSMRGRLGTFLIGSANLYSCSFRTTGKSIVQEASDSKFRCHLDYLGTVHAF